MKIVKSFKKLLQKIKRKCQNQLVLKLPKNLYIDFIKELPIDSILNNIPPNLSEMEKAYYIYIELGKILNQNPKFVFANKKGKKEHYHDKIDEEYYGICKSMSELYIRMLKDSRVGISADLVKREPESDCGHIDTILKIDEKNYIANLIIDLSRIKTSRRTNRFCFDLMNFEESHLLGDL